MAWPNASTTKAQAAFLTMAVTMTVAMGSAGHAAEPLASWKHGIVEAKGDSSVLYMPAEGGFAAARGIELEMVQFVSGTTAVRATIAGELDSFESSPVVAFTAMHRGADLKIIGCHWPVMTYSLFARADIDTIEDLRGQSIGVSTPGSLPDLFAREALAAAGVGDDEVIFGNAGGSANRFRAVAAGVVAAAASSGEFEIEAEARGLKVLLRGAEATPNFLRSCIIATARKITGRRADMVQFLASAMEGYQYALDHRAEAIAVAHKIAGLPADDRTAEFVYDEAIRYSAVTPDLDIPMAKVQWTDDMMARHGAVDARADVAAFVDDSVRGEALRLLGR